MAAAGKRTTNTQLPQFNGKNYEYWAITMRALFASQNIWELVEHGFQEPTDATMLNSLTTTERDLLKGNGNKDSKALFYIFQALHESIFPRVAA